MLGLKSNSNKIHKVKESNGCDPKQELLYGTTGHASFGSFGGIDDDLTDPLPTLVPQMPFTYRR